MDFKTPISKEDQIFRYALIISLGLHAVLLCYLSFNSARYFKKPLKRIEVAYHTTKALPKAKNAPKKDYKSIREKKLAPQPEILKGKDLSNSSVNQMTKPSNRLDFHKRRVSQANVFLKDKGRVSVQVFKSEKINNPIYLSYSNELTKRIEQKVRSNYTQGELGKVYLTFAVSSRGQITQIKIIQDRTHASEGLVELGLLSVKEANPFPPFPPDLKYPELTFNILISFTIQE